MYVILRCWSFFARHPYVATCSSPAAVYSYQRNECVIPDEAGDLSLIEGASVDMPTL